MDAQELEIKLREAIAEARQRGFTIGSHCWIDKKSKKCCPLGALAMSINSLIEDPTDILYAIRKKLNISSQEAGFFWGAFDGVSFQRDELLNLDPYASLGLKLRKEFVGN